MSRRWTETWNSLIQEDLAYFFTFTDGFGESHHAIPIRPRPLKETTISTYGVAHTVLRRSVELFKQR